MCRACNREYQAITHTHLAKHQLTIAEYLRLYPNAELGRKQRLLITREEAEDLYRDKGWSMNAIARMKGVHPDLIRQDLKYLGYEIRGHSTYMNVYDYDPVGHECLEALAIGIWMGEGTKRGRRLEVTNCDPAILRVWLRFLLTICHVDPLRLEASINIADDCLSVEAEGYWQRELGMQIRCTFRRKKTEANAEVQSRQPMGTVALRVNSKFLIERIQHRAVELSTSLM
jgi:hypothetical protein